MAIFNVTNAAGLYSALGAARGGDQINLAGGNYGAIFINGLKPTSSIVIRSADPTNPAHFDTLSVRASESLTFRGLDIGRALNPGEADYTQLTAVRDSARIVFDGNHFHGSLDGNPQNDGYGLLTQNVTALAVTNNTFEQLTRGAMLSNVRNMQVSNNRFLDIRSDGLNADGSQNAVIENNVFRGFFPTAGDHSDAIQIHNIGYDKPLTNLTVRNNVLLPGDGDTGPQGIWIMGGGTHGFKNVTIENNLLYSGGAYNGIGLEMATGAVIRNNTLISPTNDAKSLWIRLRSSTDVVLTDNITEDMIIEPSVTNLTDVNNVNLRTTPAFRDRMADIDAPNAAADLIVPQIGFQVPDGEPAAAPVSSVAGLHLASMLAPTTGQSMGAGEIDLSGVSALAEAQTVAPVVLTPTFEALTETPHWSIPTMRSFMQDWWTAIP